MDPIPHFVRGKRRFGQTARSLETFAAQQGYEDHGATTAGWSWGRLPTTAQGRQAGRRNEDHVGLQHQHHPGRPQSSSASWNHDSIS